MTTAELLVALESRGIELTADGEALRYRAPKDALTESLRRALAEHKAELLALLRDREAPFAPAPDQRYEPFPLTDVQQAFWIGRRAPLDLANVPALTYVELDLPGLDAGRLQAAFRLLIARHDMLRTVVLPDGRQQVLPEVPPFEVEVVDLRGVADPDARLAGVRERYSLHPFTQEQWPLVAACLVLLDGGRTRLHLAADLLVLDAWSLQILGRELLQLHADPALRLPPLDVSFRDWVVFEQAAQRSVTYLRELEHWRARLPELPPGPQLPLLTGAAGITSPTFQRHTGRLDAELWRRLRGRARSSGLTASALVMAAFAEVLREWSAAPRFTLNVAIFNRPPVHRQIRDVIGNFTSTILVVADGTGGTFRSRALQVQDQLAEAMEHRQVSGVRLLREAARLSDTGAPPVMSVVFTSLVSESASGRPFTLHGVADLVYGLNQPPQVWIDHQVYEEAGQLISHWDAVDGVFPPGVVDAMFDAFLGLLRELAAGEEAWRRPDRGLVPAAHLRVQEAANATGGPVAEQLLHEPCLARVAEHAADPAVVTSGRTLTYAEVERRSRGVARWLHERGARPNALVAVVMDKGWEQVVAVLGVLRAGAAYLPIDPAVPPRRLRLLLDNARVELALTQSAVDIALDWPDGIRRLAVDTAGVPDDGSPTPAAPLQTVHDLGYVIYTSGSTGQPKGVMIAHRGATNTIADLNDRFAISASDRVLGLSSLTFDLSVYDIFGLLGAGGALVLPDPEGLRDPAHWVDLMTREHVTVWNTVPALMEMLVEYLEGQQARPSPSLRLVFLSGDWIPLSLPDRIRALFPDAELVGMGGATEASIWSILHPIESVDTGWRSIPYGRPMRGQRFRVLDESMQPRPLWVPGQLYIAGAGLAEGYWRDEELTRRRFVDHPQTGERLYQTGDLGRYLPDGSIELLGRDDFQVKIRGHRIELGEIKWALTQHPAVRAAEVTTIDDADGRKRLVAYVVTEDPTAADHDWPAFLRQTLPEYMVPAHVLTLDALPLAPSGKVDRRLLPVPDSLSRNRQIVPPRTETERVVTRIWEDLLGVPGIGVTEHFFELGGDSLLATRLAARLVAELGAGLPLRTVFDRPTIEALAAAIDRSRVPGSPAARPIRRLPRSSADLASTLDTLRDAPAPGGPQRTTATRRRT